jgi:hypothetical protein
MSKISADSERFHKEKPLDSINPVNVDNRILLQILFCSFHLMPQW